MKKMNKKTLLSLGLIPSAFVLASCGNLTRSDSTDQTIDSTKTQIYVRYTRGGLRSDWIDKSIDAYSEAYKDYSFEAGKTGVQFVRDYGKANLTTASLRGSNNQIIISEDTSYSQYVSEGAMKNITDIVRDGAVTGPTTKEEETIESKLSPEFKNFFNLGSEASPSYFAIPFYNSSFMLNYNVDLFEEKGFFFKDGASGEGLSEDELTSYNDKLDALFLEPGGDASNRSSGPDGVKGTFDDGLPATFKDFQALITYMKNASVTPFIWNGVATHYLTSFAQEVFASLEGAEQFGLQLSWEGKAKDLVSFSSNDEINYDEDHNVKIAPETDITPSNAYLLQAQKGKLDAIRFLKMIVKQGCYYEKSFNSGFTHLNAQTTFLNGYEKGITDQPIGILIEGNWWNSEAIANYANEDDRLTRRYALMPVPHVSASDIGKRNTLLNNMQCVMYLNGYLDDATLLPAKTFLSYLQNQQSLETFSLNTDCTRALNYTLSEEVLGKMSYYGQSVYSLWNNSNTDSVLLAPTSEAAQRKSDFFFYQNFGFTDAQGNKNPAEYIRDNPTVSAEDYFTSIYRYYKNSWSY